VRGGAPDAAIPAADGAAVADAVAAVVAVVVVVVDIVVVDLPAFNTDHASLNNLSASFS